MNSRKVRVLFSFCDDTIRVKYFFLGASEDSSIFIPMLVGNFAVATLAFGDTQMHLCCQEWNLYSFESADVL